MAERRASLAGALLLISICSSAAAALSSAGPAAYPGQASLSVPAVTTGGEGVLSRLSVRVEPGHGRVYFSADPLTQLDTQSAARTAALVACSLLGVDPSDYDFYVSMESDSLIVGGPSAGAAMAVAMAAAIANLSLRGDVVITGMVNPDGTIGPVGGVPEKLRAAAEGGAHVFLVPAGQSVVVESRVVEEKGPFWVTRRVVREQVNVTQLGLELGVEVREVLTVREALSVFTGLESTVETPKSIDLPEEVRTEISRWLESYLEAYSSSRDEAASVLDGISSRPLRRYVSDALSLADGEAAAARDLASRGRVYSAVSAAFRAAMEADRSMLVARMATSKSPDEVLLSYASQANASISSAESLLSSESPGSLSELEILVGAWERLYDAKKAMSRADSAYRSGDLISAAEWLCYARWRARTAEDWASLEVSGGPAPPPESVSGVASTMMYEAESVVGYATTLLEEVGAGGDLLERATSSLEMAREAEAEGRIYAVIGLSAEAIAYSTMAVHGVFSTADLESLIMAISNESRGLVWRAMSSGAVPVLALSYMEHAEVSESGGDLKTALLFYELAATYANLDCLLARARPPRLIPTETPEARPAPRQPRETPAPELPGGFGWGAVAVAGLVGFAAGSVAALALSRRREDQRSGGSSLISTTPPPSGRRGTSSP